MKVILAKEAFSQGHIYTQGPLELDEKAIEKKKKLGWFVKEHIKGSSYHRMMSLKELKKLPGKNLD